jgi:hypothetical protein
MPFFKVKIARWYQVFLPTGYLIYCLITGRFYFNYHRWIDRVTNPVYYWIMMAILLSMTIFLAYLLYWNVLSRKNKRHRIT